METLDTASPSRKEMPAKVFIKIWKGEMEVAGTEWEEVVQSYLSLLSYSKVIRFMNVEVKETIWAHIKDSSIPQLNLSNCLVNTFKIDHSDINSIYFENHSEIGNIEIENSHVYRIIHRDSSLRHLTIKAKSRIGRIFLQHSKLLEVNVSEASYVGYFQYILDIQTPPHFVFKKSKIAHLDFNNTVLPEFMTLHVTDCKVNRLTLSGFCNYGTIFFSNLMPIGEWEDFKKDNNNDPGFIDGVFIFETLTLPSVLRLTASDLGKIQFINCDLRNFDRFEFSNTKMLDVFVAGSQMPDDNAFCLPNDEKNPLKIAEQKRLAYGQFKKIYENRGDVAGSLPYLAYEMEAYRKQLQLEGRWKNRGELVMLWANKISTNYGVSWQRGLALIMVAMIFFYSIFCYLIGYQFENNSPDDMERFWKLVSYAPYYLNPLRDLDSVSLVKEEDFTPCARIWDFISRIVVAYLVYQTIQAFRKLGKSSG